jgi:LacI family transcriptional regulator
VSVTIRDVARAAGVSVATVSRVLNGSGPTSDDARERVQRAASALRYAPDAAARTLSTRSTRTFGALLPDLYGEFFSEVIRGMDQASRARGFHLLISSSHADQREIEGVLRAMRGRVDGLVLMSPEMDGAALAHHLPDGLPVALLNSAVESIGGRPVRSIAVDNRGGAYAMVRHLAAIGHQRIAIITGGLRNHDALERLRGYREALCDAGLPHDDLLVLEGDFMDAGGYDAARQALALDPRPTALFASNDMMAIGALSAMRDAGVSVPDEIAVVGFDDIPLARHVTPPLTTVHVDNTELGARAVACLVEAIGASEGDGDGRALGGRELVPTSLVIRASCGATRRAVPAAMPPPYASLHRAPSS